MCHRHHQCRDSCCLAAFLLLFKQGATMKKKLCGSFTLTFLIVAMMCLYSTDKNSVIQHVYACDFWWNTAAYDRRTRKLCRTPVVRLGSFRGLIHIHVHRRGHRNNQIKTDRRTIIELQLIRSGIEANPGPQPSPPIPHQQPAETNQQCSSSRYVIILLNAI